jgi:hypothetical protein
MYARSYGSVTPSETLDAMLWYVVHIKHAFILSPSLSFLLLLYLELGMQKPLFPAVPLLLSPNFSTLATRMQHIGSLDSWYRKKKKEDVARRSPRSGPTTIGPKTAFRPLLVVRVDLGTLINTTRRALRFLRPPAGSRSRKYKKTREITSMRWSWFFII